MKKNNISDEEGFAEINNILSPKNNYSCRCEKRGNKQDIRNTRCKYPDGLAIDTLDITYCETCGTVINVEW